MSEDSGIAATPHGLGGEERTLDTASSLSGGPGAYAVKLAAFEGPLDLLLHLIRQNEVEITDIPVASIGAQYLEYLELMQELNLDLAGEYLVMAATLALIKSRMLLPPDEDDEEEEGDPRAELVARLLEYQRFKEAAEALSRRRRLGRDVFEARGPGPERVPDAEREIEVGLFELIEAFRQVLQTIPTALRGVHEVEAETVTVRERMLAVIEVLEDREWVEFHRVFEVAEGEVPTRAVVVATFLAILELARLSVLRIFQSLNAVGVPEGPIRLRRAGDTEASWHEQIPDQM